MGGMNLQGLYNQGAAQQQMQQQQIKQQEMAQNTQTTETAAGWTCACGKVNTGKFCIECGKQKPADGWTCSCGTVNRGNSVWSVENQNRQENHYITVINVAGSLKIQRIHQDSVQSAEIHLMRMTCSKQKVL